MVLLRHILASYVLGWFLVGGCIAIGASGAIRPQPFLRAVSRLGFYSVAAAPFLYGLALILGGDHLHVLTPIGLLLPLSFPSTSTFFGNLLYVWEDFFGMTLPRLSFLFPWATAMGFGGICLVWVAASDTDTRRRRLAQASGVFMVFASMSRSAIVVLLVCTLARVFLALPRGVRFVIVPSGIAVACALLLGSTLSSGQPLGMFGQVLEDLREVRPGATQARDRVHDATVLGVDESPLFGKGWPGEPVYPEDFPQVMQGTGTMVPGSHSTYLGLWYLGGAATMTMWILAWSITFVRVAASGAPARFVRNSVVLTTRHRPDRHERVDLRHGGAHALCLHLARHRHARRSGTPRCLCGPSSRRASAAGTAVAGARRGTLTRRIRDPVADAPRPIG